MRIAMALLALALATTGCKKKETKPAETTGSAMVGSDQGAGSAAGSAAAGSDTGSAMAGSDTGSAAEGSAAGSAAEVSMSKKAGNCPSTVLGATTKAALKGKDLDMALGFSHPVTVKAPEGIEFEVPAPNRITIRGNDKQAVGEIAANIRKIRKPEPYKGKGIRYEGEYVRKKAGKAAKGATK